MTNHFSFLISQTTLVAVYPEHLSSVSHCALRTSFGEPESTIDGTSKDGKCRLGDNLII